VATALTGVLAGDPIALVAATCLDLLIGDPVYRAHPVRLSGRALTALERGLRGIGADGYVGGVALFVLLTGLSLAVVAGVVLAAARISSGLASLRRRHRVDDCGGIPAILITDCSVT
jgi:cobalamin biosynthesis protein CobD/CbiB